MTKQFFNIIAIDFKRAFYSYHFLIAVLGVAISCFATIPFIGYYQVDVVYVWLKIHTKSQSMLTFLFALYPFALCFYHDFEYKNIHNIIGMISINLYGLSKISIGILSSCIAYMLGKLFFVLILSMELPFSNPSMGTIDNMKGSGFLFFSLLEQDKFIDYFILSSLLQGLCAGVLMLVALLLSLFIFEKAVIFSIPIGIFYILNNYLRNGLGLPMYFDIYQIFGGIETIWNSDIISFLYGVFCAMVLWIILGYWIIRKLKKRIYYE